MFVGAFVFCMLSLSMFVLAGLFFFFGPVAFALETNSGFVFVVNACGGFETRLLFLLV